MAMKTVDVATLFTVGPLIDDTDFKTLETAIAFNAAGMDVSFYQEQADGTITKTALTLTSGSTQDWTAVGDGYYSVEITAAQNNTECSAWVAGVCTGVLPFESGRFDMVPANVVDALVKGTDALQVHTNEITNNLITSSTIATDAIGADQIAANAIGSSELAAGAITAAKFGAGAIDATAIADGAIDAATFAAGAINAAAIADGAIDAATFAAGAIDASAIAADAIGSLELTTTAVNEIRDAILDAAMAAELASLPSQTVPTVRQMLQFLYQRYRNRYTLTSTQAINYKADGTTALQTSAVSDDGTTVVRGAGA